MPRTAALLLLVLGTASLGAAEPVRPATLTSQEIADGWLFLWDGATTFGWRAEGPVAVADGVLVLGGREPVTLTTTTAFGGGEVRISSRQAIQGGAVHWRGEKQPLGGGAGWSEMTYEPGTPGVSPIALTLPAERELRVRWIKFRPTNLKSIFNGKDLTGWKRFDKEPGRAKSTFRVTPEGWLNVKDGPGDLQTTEAWADFVLQLDCISNGKHLNSGVFFRCRPGEYQQGYEAQVRNQFTPEATQEYAVEVYDPKTHALVEKRKVMSPAVDFGTGAIYRRVPARTAVARDGEWFTLTLIAQGRHFATWVNGVPQVDWNDHRPAKDNARNGCRLEAGPISLQGHDPTTDLSFRNFRVAAWSPRPN